jgi:TRAP-type C4-dicarboxylate transport system substrate-binding protein
MYGLFQKNFNGGSVMNKTMFIQLSRSFLVGIMLATFFISFATFVSAGEVKPVILKYASYAPPQHSGTIIAQETFPMVEKLTEGRVKVEVYHSETLFPARETVNALDKGIADLAFYPLNYMAGQVPWLNATLIPGLITDFGGMYLSFKDGLKDLIQKDLHSLGLKVQVVGIPFTPGISVLMTKGKRVVVPSDLKGLKIACPSKGDTEVVKQLGGTPIAMPSTESYEALSKGVVNGAISNFGGMYGRKLYEPGDYLTIVPLGSAAVAVLASETGLAKLSPVDRNIVLYVAERRGLEETFLNAYMEQGFLAKMKPHLKEIVYPTKEQLKKWEEKLGPIQDSFVKANGDKGKQVISIIKKNNE